jgi:hypothetical protein
VRMKNNSLSICTSSQGKCSGTPLLRLVCLHVLSFRLKCCRGKSETAIMISRELRVNPSGAVTGISIWLLIGVLACATGAQGQVGRSIQSRSKSSGRNWNEIRGILHECIFISVSDVPHLREQSFTGRTTRVTSHTSKNWEKQ